MDWWHRSNGILKKFPQKRSLSGSFLFYIRDTFFLWGRALFWKKDDQFERPGLLEVAITEEWDYDGSWFHLLENESALLSIRKSELNSFIECLRYFCPTMATLRVYSLLFSGLISKTVKREYDIVVLDSKNHSLTLFFFKKSLICI